MTRNKHYRPVKKQCAICRKCVDCAAKVKPYKEIKGKTYHTSCLMNKAAELLQAYLDTL